MQIESDMNRIKFFIVVSLLFACKTYAGLSDTSKYFGGSGEGYALYSFSDSLVTPGYAKYFGGAGNGYYFLHHDQPLPVELTSFSFSILNSRDVLLKWRTENEFNNSGFDIERAVQLNNSANLLWKKISFVSGNNIIAHADYYFTDKKLSSGSYLYRLKQIDFNGSYRYYFLSSEVEIGVPQKYNLSQNYPNPFNPSTTIDFDLPFESKVVLSVYDVSGREILKLADKIYMAGYHTIEFGGGNFSSGIYFYVFNVESGNTKFHSVKKMIMVK